MNADPDALFKVLTDVDRVVTCVPGAELLSSDDNEHQGRVIFKVGPVTAAFEGTVRFTETIPAQRIMKLVASGSDSNGNGTAEASVTITVFSEEEVSLLRVETDVLVRGKFAQFGKGAISVVAKRILGQFAKNITKLLDEEGPAHDVVNGAEAVAPRTNALSTPSHAPATPVATAPAWAFVTFFLFGCVEGWILTRAFSRKNR